MTIDGRTFDGWPIHPDFVKPAKNPNFSENVLTGRDLAQFIFDSIEKKGVVLSEDRKKKIAAACE